MDNKSKAWQKRFLSLFSSAFTLSAEQHWRNAL
ncbi:hypothetical protein EPIR_0520 [Erwinia piriflorinigrans CFBP 5888]|uniref:Uncharacterized protein n=1 Tax=Erwinia piriflorinigrans CFBP 5888 TaxID=1161919 RepID=V5Z3I5_9GAMM|nr:hypothetical protein EPIR_0520 [Erwinia piriflorinigrans CFBP 5888]